MGYGGWVDGSTMNVTSFTSGVLPAVTLVSSNYGQVDKIVERNSRSTFFSYLSCKSKCKFDCDIKEKPSCAQNLAVLEKARHSSNKIVDF